ncbi:hypothetical protein E2562_033664 [Oryza meyeriana var. granulata]|uniref:Dehydrin n=1 Tax=Oryza meyeriana var. granulata TaxID=110450 RepID=A0A6G1CBV1_9ORYZ|nr:hypothetical protein E2562_033664 [Oryza meyeriana var. granulata]
MENYQEQHGYGADRVNVYGNPVAAKYGGATTPSKGAAMGMGGHGAGRGQFQPAREDYKTGGIMHRSGSSSSSSQQMMGTAGGAYGQQGHAGMTGVHGAEYGNTGEKKGFMDKIKEKLPGQH